jgi:hypothetical protein
MIEIIISDDTDLEPDLLHHKILTLHIILQKAFFHKSGINQCSQKEISEICEM